jgi:UDP-GlcNAc3NAcA epimerase
MPTIKIITVVGARPQFIKAASVSRAVAAHNAAGGRPLVSERIVHTGQHYDDKMSQVFFDELHIPAPAVNLGVGSGPHGRQTGAMLEQIETVLVEGRPDYVLVYGDTNSTLAASLAAVKLHIPVAHVEAGVRSFNRRMPEEINRVVTDTVSTLLFCPTQAAVDNLAREGITRGVHRLGDVMYDSVLFNGSLAQGQHGVLERLGVDPKTFYLATIHRPENTDDPSRLSAILAALGRMDAPVILPLHPRTRKILDGDHLNVGPNVRLIDPVPYLEMLLLERSARLILTDSGGVQKEAYWFGVPCVTLRDETEWVELVQAGCNVVVGADAERIVQAAAAIEGRGAVNPPTADPHLYGDGHCGDAIVRLLATR